MYRVYPRGVGREAYTGRYTHHGEQGGIHRRYTHHGSRERPLRRGITLFPKEPEEEVSSLLRSPEEASAQRYPLLL